MARIEEVSINIDEVSFINARRDLVTGSAFKLYDGEVLELRVTVKNQFGSLVVLTGDTYKITGKNPADLAGTLLFTSTDITPSWTDLPNGLVAFDISMTDVALGTFIADSNSFKTIQVEILRDTTVDEILVNGACQGKKSITLA